MPEQSQSSQEFSSENQESSPEGDIFGPVTRLTRESSDQERMDVVLQISDTPVKVLRHSGAVEDWKIAGLGEEDDSGHPTIEVYRQSVTDKDEIQTRVVPVNELRAWQSEEGLKKVVEANTEQVDWSKIPAIGDRKSGRFLSVADIQKLREDRIKPFPGGAKGSAAYETRGQKAQETVDILLPQDEAPQDSEQARRYEVRRNALKAALVVGERRFSEKKQVWLERYGAVTPVAQPHKKPDVKETTNIVPPETRTGDPPSGNEPVELTDEERALIDRYNANKKPKKSQTQTGDQLPNDVKKYLKRLGFDKNGDPIISPALPIQPVIPVIPPPGTNLNATGGSPVGHEASPRTPEQRSDLETAREAKHKAYVARLKGPVFLRPQMRKELQSAYEQAQKQYKELLDTTTKEELDGWLQERKTGPEIEQLIAKNTNKRFREDVEAQRQLLITESGWVGEFLNRYANYGRVKKIGVTIGLGAVGLGIGFGAGVLAGVAGGVGLGLGLAGGVAAGSMKLFGAARVYKLRQADLFKKQDDLAVFDADKLGDGTNRPTPEGMRRLSLDFLEKQSDEQLRRGETIKRKAVYWTLGTVAVGGLAGAGAHILSESNADHLLGGQTQHWLEQWQNRAIPTEPGDGSGGGNVTGGEIPKDPDIGAVNGATTKSEILKEYLKEHGAAKRIDRGEGWFQTFKELGISAGDRRAFLEEYGDDLLKKFPEVTYKMPNGEPGILMTDDRKMPKEVLEYIVKHANHEGWLKHPLDFSHVTSNGNGHGVVEAASNGPRMGLSDFDMDTSHTTGAGDNIIRLGRSDFVGTGSDSATAEAANKLIASQELVPANTVSHGESITRTLNELKRAGVIDIPSDEYHGLLRGVGPRLAKIEYPDGTPVAYLNRFPPYDWRLNRSPDGRLHAKAIRLIERVARERGLAKAA